VAKNTTASPPAVTKPSSTTSSSAAEVGASPRSRDENNDNGSLGAIRLVSIPVGLPSSRLSERAARSRAASVVWRRTQSAASAREVPNISRRG